MSTMLDRAEFLTTGAVARELELSETTIRKYDAEGRLTSVRTSAGVRLFKREDIDAFRALRSRG